LAHSIKPTVQVGKDGVSDKLIMAADDALFTHELIKLKILEAAPCNRKEAAPELAKRLGAHMVSLVGRTVTLYRAHPEKPQIQLP
jgi:RNA-binding protein